MNQPAPTLLSLVIFFAITCPLAFAEEPPEPADRELAADLKLMQGTWEMFHKRGPDGQPTLRSVRTVEGNKETLRRFSTATGEKLHEHSVEFQLSKSGDVHVLTFYPVGGSPKNGLSYVYKLDKDTFYDIPGLLRGGKYRNYQNTPTIWRWTRIADDAKAEALKAVSSTEK